LKTSAGLAAGTLFAEQVRAAPPPPSTVTPGLIEAARKEGRISYYSALELNVAERLGKAFEAKYPGIFVHVERSGAERIYQRIAQEQGSGINAVDVANSTDPALISTGSRSTGSRPIFPTTSPSIFRPTSSTRTDCGQPHVPGWRSSGTTPIW
jgi:iron(III) transport system substrate-binding protein